MNTTIFGAGYAGLVTGACQAGMGHRVMCADVDHSRIARIHPRAGDARQR